MKIEDLLSLKIDIQTKDDTNFLELAIFFDKPEFLQMLPQFRKDYGIDRLIDPDKYPDRISELDKRTSKINFSKYRNSKEWIKSSPDIDQEMDIYQMLDTEANLICYQFKRPPCFVEAVKQAVFCGSVEGDWLGTTSIEVIESGIPLNASAFQLPQMAILISPTTTYKTLKNSFQIAQSMYKTNPKLSYFQPRVDFVNNIRKYREWYWQRIELKTYQMIADEWLTEHENENTTYLDVLKAVKIYKKLLNL
ncbi:hypothetical protein A3A63_01090 [Candidatus Gottesmanbacteria bacterium RIFCSPLOWO2_01_FULL_46_9]|uniref:Uncharacterized protein n=1 Tax=Candidatus Gottesmanbacteria bacterium RIFCSPLOWO2_01_FULL_46_9 TaxID=1798394 RepID=A0A1F6B3P8_9BACT|nr:MAG: hypothetical protein A3A63_01090 [Candidatus Gottesmanbacteria bacterium RIFCSPLOWO2_01_FULL_46_9]